MGVWFGNCAQFGLMIAQVVYGFSANSVALLADAGHNFGDALGLMMAWGAHVMGRSPPTERYTYGFRSASIYSALINAILLLVATGAIAWEAIQRFGQPEEVGVRTMMIVAAGAIVANLAEACHDLSRKFKINHATIQIEGDAEPCILEPAHTV